MELANDRSLTSPPPASPSRPSWVGKRVGRFRLINLMGQGSMGRVFRAEDTQLQRHVALKVIVDKEKSGTEQSDRVQQFIQEARAVARLEHPHVVHIYEVNQVSDVHYIAMELVEGGSLHSLLKGGPLDVQRACQLCAEAAEALQFAHESGIIHRDVKPANLMLTRSGRCKLADFGLAHAGDPPDPSRPARSNAVGTPLYAAPEVIRHLPATPQTDIYSLGATLFHLLAGRPPFTGDSAVAVLEQHLTEPIPDLRALRDDVPVSLLQAIIRAMAKAPSDRFESAGQFASVLRLHTVAVAGGSRSLAGLVPGQEPLSSSWLGYSSARNIAGSASVADPLAATRVLPMPRRPHWWLGLAIAAGIMLVGAVGVVLMVRQQKASESTPAQQVATAPPAAAGAAQPDSTAQPDNAALPGTSPEQPSVVDPSWMSTAPPPAATSQPPAAAPADTLPPSSADRGQPAAVPPRQQQPSAPTSDVAGGFSATDTQALLQAAQQGGREKVAVVGRVRSVEASDSGKVYYILFEGVGARGFFGAIFPSRLETMTRAFPGGAGDVPNLAGKSVRLEGRLQIYNGRPEVVIESPDQVRISE